jgi:putative DNA primase/helicase
MAPNECLGEITLFQKSGGPLTKRIALRDSGIVNDSSACRMANGTARRVRIDRVQTLAHLINNFTSSEAYALGRIKDEHPDRVHVVTFDKLNGALDPTVIARTLDYLVFKESEPGFALLDVDLKGMPEDTARRFEKCCPWGALCEVLPELETVAFVERASTSSGLRNRETGECFAGSGGCHIVVPVLDAADIPRFLSDFHERCWLKGWGWGMVSAAGLFLERAIIDKACGSPERLIFEGPPIIAPPLEQTGRNAIAHDGSVLDTRLCSPLTDDEKVELRKLKANEECRLLPERQAARAKWSAEHVARLKANGMSEAAARGRVDRWLDRQELSGDFPLPFDDPNITGTTVADVLAAPDGYINKTLSDPFEGPDYGRDKAKLYRRPDGSLFIKSFAHGGIIYELKATTKADDDAELERLARLSPLEYGRARKEAAKRLGVTVEILTAAVAANRSKLGIGNPGQQGRALDLPAPEPWPKPVDGAELLDDITAAIQRHVVMTEHTARGCALWCLHTYLLDCFLISPRLAIRSATHRCGKTTLLDTISHLALRTLSSANVTAASVFRVIEACRPTLLIDEADTFLPGAEELRGVINSGHRKGGTVIRTVGDDHEPRAFSTYAACAIALIGTLPATLHDRSAPVIDLKRRLRSEKVDNFRLDRTAHLDVLARKAARWAADKAEQIRDTDPELPAVLFNRDADNWRPLLAIADVAGGKWPKQGREAAALYCTVAGVGDASQLELLLADIRELFAAKQADANTSASEIEVSSAEMVKALGALEGRPWAEMGKSRKPLTQNRLARLLNPLHIAPGAIGPEEARVRGYRRSQFQEAFDRYLAPLSEGQPSQTSPKGVSQPSIRPECDETGTSDISQPSSLELSWTVAECEKPNNDGVLDGWTVAGSGEETCTRPPYEVLGPAPGGERCTLCGSGGGVERIKHRGRVNLWHPACADRYLAAMADPPVKVPDLGPDPLDENGAPRAASVPFMLTQDMKRRLRAYDYSDEEIAHLTPQQAHEILAKEEGRRPNG